MNLFPSKLPSVGTTIFTEMSALARTHQAINLSQGFPDFPSDPRLAELAAEAMRQGHNQYAPMAGLLPLREKIAELQRKWYGATYDPVQEITITSGATEALMSTILALVRSGDEVMVLEPAYDSYVPAIELAGGVPILVPLQFPEFRIDWERVRAKLSSRTTAILINSPHNPTGAMISAEDLIQLAELAESHDLLVIADEVYEHIRFDGRVHHSISGHARLRERSVVISSFGKSLHLTGWKVGYALAPEAISREIRKVHQFATFSTSTPFQHAIYHYLDQHLEQVEALGAFYQAKRDRFLDLMAETPFKPLPCPGTYFQLMRYDAISDLPEADFAKWLTREKGVAVIPVSAFYQQPVDHQVVRFCFAKEDQTLEAAAERLMGVSRS
ncbi:MAG: methionine aminotransferase [Bacteroidota bacterium]